MSSRNEKIKAEVEKKKKQQAEDRTRKAQLTVQNTGQAMSRANNYAVESNMPPADPVKRVDIMDVEALAAKVAEGPVALCRCYKSTTFPYCDGSHTAHNEATGDNVGPLVVKNLGGSAGGEGGEAAGGGGWWWERLVVKAGQAPEQRGLDFKTEISAEEKAKAVAGPRANNYGVASNMPPDAPVKIVDMVDIEDVKAAVGAKGVVSFCRCFNSKSFPLCDGSHGDHNEACGDNTGPVVLKNLPKP